MGDPKQLDTPTAQAAANISVFLDSFYKFHDHTKYQLYRLVIELVLVNVH